ncbi:flagellar hook-length control protein FliK [Mixta intestinalis]|jgi:flagellar hook-length control protein FliK|uniref:Flagellar hook-length control protein n=1 Tax=Mixta intestinalis TaxID=1615494 RepID=A0A6P1Q4T9_9GAMM|nr:flagellar hook-length control protein FliK [Mixta intestinalis]QHM73234.1 Flagellar hook-length control protein [Mixta intestinalis]
MMVNVVAALTGASYDNTGNAPTEAGENGDFASALGMQLALLPLAVGGQLPTGEALPEGEVPVELDVADENKPDEANDEQWLIAPPVMTPATLIETAIAPALPLTTAQVTTAPETADLATEPHKSAVTDMLRMIASPQSAVATEPTVTPQTQAATQNVVQQQSAGAFIVPDQPEQEQVATDIREPVTLDNAPTAEHRPVTMPFTTSTSTISQPSSPATPVTPSTVHATLEEKVGSPAWQQALGHQLSSFTRNGVHHAELRLHPEELGPLQINLRLSHDQAQLHFMTEHHQVRAALEAAMPHLRASLAESGIQLDQGSVGSEAPAWGSPESGFGQSSQSQRDRETAMTAEAEEETSTRLIHSQASGISIFA